MLNSVNDSVRAMLPPNPSVLRAASNAVLFSLVVPFLLATGCGRDANVDRDANLNVLVQELKANPTNPNPATLEALGFMGPHATPAIPLILQSLESKDFFVRRSATMALVRLKSTNQEAVSSLARMLLDPSEVIWTNAALGLANIGAPSVPALIAALESDSATAITGAASALKRIEPSATNAIPALVGALRTDSWQARIEIAEALGKMGETATPLLIDGLEGDDPDLREASGPEPGRPCQP